MTEMFVRAAKALCLVQFGDKATHGDARCCQAGGIDGCCLDSLLPQVTAVMSVGGTQLADIADRHSYEAAQAIRAQLNQSISMAREIAIRNGAKIHSRVAAIKERRTSEMSE